MKFIDRQAEMQRLDALAGKADGGLVVVWGRRRLGKTRLLLGEVKWTDKPASEKTLQQAIHDLKAKGIPGSLQGKRHQVVYALFVPQTLSRRRHQQDVHVVNAREVLSCLR
jgi:hypothetical protein